MVGRRFFSRSLLFCEANLRVGLVGPCHFFAATLRSRQNCLNSFSSSRRRRALPRRRTSKRLMGRRPRSPTAKTRRRCGIRFALWALRSARRVYYCKRRKWPGKFAWPWGRTSSAGVMGRRIFYASCGNDLRRNDLRIFQDTARFMYF